MDEPSELDSQTRSLMQESLMKLWRDLKRPLYSYFDIDGQLSLPIVFCDGVTTRPGCRRSPRPLAIFSETTLLPEFLRSVKLALI